MHRTRRYVVWASLLLNVAVGCLACWFALGYRGQQLAKADDAHALLEREQMNQAILQRRADTGQARLEGLRADDPYVIELIARERLGYAASNDEIVAPRQSEQR